MSKEIIEEEWQSIFLNAGTEKGLGDLSMMISTISDIIQSKTASAYKEGLTENIANLERTSEKYKTLFWCIRQDLKEQGYLEEAVASAVEARESSYREEVLSKLRSATCYADPSRGVLLSNPPQHQCEACGRRWVVGEKTPVCDYIRKADITNLNPSKE